MADKLIGSSYDFQNVARVKGLPTAIANGQPVTFEQLNAAIEGIKAKPNVRVRTQGNINLASPGATIDSLTMAVNDRVLVPLQTSQPENGLYIYNGPSTPMTRAPDASTAAELESAVVAVNEGSNAGLIYRQTSVAFTLGSGNVVWIAFGTSAGPASETSAGIAEVATQAETDGGLDDLRFVSSLKLAAWSGRRRTGSLVIGDGSQTLFTATHNWGHRRVGIQVIKNSGNFDTIDVDSNRATINTVQVVFDAGLAPASNAFLLLYWEI